MLKIRDKYITKTIEGKFGKLVVSEIPESSFEYWYKNGLEYIFEKPVKRVVYTGVKKKYKQNGSNTEGRV